MSKAFTNEDAPETIPMGRIPERAVPGQERPITEAGYQALREQRQALLDTPKPTDDAELSVHEHRLALVSATLDSVRVVSPPESNDTVAFGHRVTVLWEDGRRQTVQLVGPDEAEASEGRISIASPIARALVGLGVDDEGELVLPRGTEHFEIVAIE